MAEQEIIHSGRGQGQEKALDLINLETGEHKIPKYETFCLDYAQHFNPNRAMAAAGYPVDDKTKHQMECAFRRVMMKRDIQMRIQGLIRDKALHMGVGPDWVVMKWMELLDRATQANEVLNDDGEGTGEWRYEARAANDILHDMAQYFGMFTKEKTDSKPVQINVNFAGVAPKDVAIDGEVVDVSG